MKRPLSEQEARSQLTDLVSGLRAFLEKHRVRNSLLEGVPTPATMLDGTVATLLAYTHRAAQQTVTCVQHLLQAPAKEA